MNNDNYLVGKIYVIVNNEFLINDAFYGCGAIWFLCAGLCRHRSP